MKINRELSVGNRTPDGRAAAFTLIEIMLVVFLMALICATGIPTIYQLAKKEGMRRAVTDLKEVCANARAQAIFSGKEVQVVFYPLARRYGISAGAPAPTPTDGGETPSASPEPPSVEGVTGIIPDNIMLEMLDVNLSEYKDSDWTRVCFYPNGTSDEMTIVYRSAGEYRKLVLEPTTALLSQGKMQ
jgi:type II secretory pathway pseudopilin PulG